MIAFTCQEAKLVWGKELYFDSTQVNANADLDSLTPRFAVEAREAIQEHLTALFAAESAPLEKPEAISSEAPLPEPLAEAPFDAEPTPLPAVLSEAQYEELAAENAARHVNACVILRRDNFDPPFVLCFLPV